MSTNVTGGHTAAKGRKAEVSEEFFELFRRSTCLSRNEKVRLLQSIAGQVGAILSWPGAHAKHDSNHGNHGGSIGNHSKRLGTSSNPKGKKKGGAKPQPKSKYADWPEYTAFQAAQKELRRVKRNLNLGPKDHDDERIKNELAAFKAARDNFMTRKKSAR